MATAMRNATSFMFITGAGWGVVGIGGALVVQMAEIVPEVPRTGNDAGGSEVGGSPAFGL